MCRIRNIGNDTKGGVKATPCCAGYVTFELTKVRRIVNKRGSLPTEKEIVVEVRL